MRIRTLAITACVTAMMLGSASQACAISSITNSLSLSDQTISTNQSVKCTAKTVYDNTIITNPYSSSFYTEMNGYHFNKPSTTGYSGFSSVSWAYKSTGRFTSPAYAFNAGTLWFSGTSKVTKWVSYADTAKSAASGSRRNNRHGQYQGTWDSVGGQIVRVTAHN